MKKNTLFVGALALLGAYPLSAQDLVIETMKSNENIELIKDAKFDPAYGNIGNTSPETLICLGEVDFGADGNTYQATGVEFAQGWGNYEDKRYVVLHAGETYEESIVFNEIETIRTFGYHCFEMFAKNMGEDESFERPIGKQKVWLTFREGNGNLRSVKFYKERVAEEGMQPLPKDLPGYEDKAQIIPASIFEAAIEIDPEGPYKDAKYNEETECWGGVLDSFIVKSSEKIDFDNGEYKQLVAYIGHDGERYKEYMEFYIDEVKPENMIARTWSGINLNEWNSFTPIATKLEEIKGSHYLFVKWGAATNLHRIDLVKEELWYENPDCGVVYENIQPSEKAVKYVTVGGGTQGSGKIDEGEIDWEIILPGSSEARGEGANIGFTSNGVVVAYYDIDFKEGDYKRVLINHSCDKKYIGTIEEANFSLYIDLDDVDWSAITDPEEVKNALAEYEPIAVVRAQGSDGWSIHLTTAASLKTVQGIHNLYIVYNLPSDGTGANIYGVYLDPETGESGIKQVASMEGLEIYSATNEIIINSAQEANITIYTINGVQVADKAIAPGSVTISNLPSGLYLLKAINKENKVSVSKVMVK